MSSHAEIALDMLRVIWDEVESQPIPAPSDPFDGLIDEVFSGQETGYKKAIVIQAAGKAADPTLDAQAMQKGDGNERSWDAREFAKQSFVKWNLEANKPFAHSADPYVSNPYRIPRFDSSQRAGRKRPREFDNTLLVLEHLNGTTDATVALSNLKKVLEGLRRYLSDKDVSYPLPNRASLEAVISAADEFLSNRSGGTRLQAVVAALIQTLAKAGLNVGDVLARHVNASDTSAGQAGDVVFGEGQSVFAIEVKDKPLSSDEVSASVDKARVAGITDLMFVVRANVIFESTYEEEDFRQSAKRQFSSGLNMYIESFADFARLCLSIVGEPGRRTFLEEVGQSLATQNADIAHKWAWSKIVRTL